MPEQYTPQQYREAAQKWAEKLGLLAYGPNEINYWPVIDWIALNESGWQGIQSHVPDPAGPGGREDSWGPFQLLRVAGLGGDKTPKELLDPDTNAEIALRKIKDMLDQGYDIDGATWDWAVTHDVDMEWVLANPGVSPAPGQAGTPAAPAPIAAGAGGVAPDRNDPKYIFTAEQVGLGGMYQGLGVVGGFNYTLYAADMDAWRLATEDGAAGPDEIDYINAAVDMIAMQLQGEQIDVQKADLELQKRLGALTEAGKTYRELAPYALPEGAEWIPGGEPGGIYEKLGLGPMPAATTRINPLAAALAVMGETPEMGPAPATSFEAALAGAQQLRGGMGTEVAPPAAPSAVGAPAPTIPPPTLEEVVAGIEPGPMSPARQPSGFPDFPPPAGVGAVGPEGYQPYEPEVLSPEEANRIAAIIIAILGSLGGGGSQPLATPTPTPPGIFGQALRGR